MMNHPRHHTMFSRVADCTARYSGHQGAFLVALLVIGVWLITGPVFHFSDTWQLFINTGTTVVTFLMVFLIQHAQSRDSMSIQLKLDELIRAIKDAGNDMLDLERLDLEELEEIRTRYERMAAEARDKLHRAAEDRQVSPPRR